MGSRKPFQKVADGESAVATIKTNYEKNVLFK